MRHRARGASARVQGAPGALDAGHKARRPEAARDDAAGGDLVNSFAEAARLAKGVYTVTRLCCRSGMCLTCQTNVVGGSRKRVVHADNVNEATARKMLAGWYEFEPRVEPPLPKVKS